MIVATGAPPSRKTTAASAPRAHRRSVAKRTKFSSNSATACARGICVPLLRCQVRMLTWPPAIGLASLAPRYSRSGTLRYFSIGHSRSHTGRRLHTVGDRVQIVQQDILLRYRSASRFIGVFYCRPVPGCKSGRLGYR